jgi:hypothetical protein
MAVPPDCNDAVSSLQPPRVLYRLFLIMNRFLLIILAVLILGSVGFGLVQLDEIRKLKQNLATLDQERSALQKRIWDLQKQNGDLENRLTRTPGGGTPAVARSDPAGDMPRGNWPAAAGSRPDGRGDPGRFGAMMANPEVQKLMAIQQKAALDSRYASLFKQMQLAPADLDKFKSLLVEKQSAVMDVVSAARAQGLSGPDSREQIQQLVQNAQAEVDANIRSTLGDAAFAQYQTYEATMPERTVVTQLEQRLSYSSTPLTDAQSAQLVQILAQTAPPGGNSGTTTGGGGLGRLLGGATGGGPAGIFGGGGTPITNEAITSAQGILSAQQLAALQSLQQEQQTSAQLRQQMRANFGGPASGAATPAAGTATPPLTSGPGGG